MKSPLLQKYRYSLILLKELVITEFKLRYQGSVLGYLWSLLRPLFLFVILYLVFVEFLKIGSNVPHWPVALLLGIVLWNFFTEVTSNGLISIVNRGDVIRKINFPKYVILLAGSVSAFINLLLNLLVIVVFMVINQVNLSWMAILSPLFVIEIFVLALGLSFILSTVFVRLRDMNYIWEIVLQALFYASAIMYPISIVIEKNATIAKLMLLNPIAQAIQDTRFTLISDQNPTLLQLSHGNVFLAGVPVVVVLGIAWYGAWLFRKRSPYFAEEV